MDVTLAKFEQRIPLLVMVVLLAFALFLAQSPATQADSSSGHALTQVLVKDASPKKWAISVETEKVNSLQASYFKEGNKVKRQFEKVAQMNGTSYFILVLNKKDLQTPLSVQISSQENKEVNSSLLIKE